MASRHKEKTILEDKKIVIKRDMLQRTSIGILKNLEDKSLLKAYLYLDEIGGSLETGVTVDKNGRDPKSSNDLINEYRLHLEVSANSKNTIKDYCREIKRFLEYIGSGGNDINTINTCFLNSYLFKQKTERKLSNNSYSRLVIVIRSFLSYLYKEKIILKPLALELKIPRRVDKEREYLTESEIQKVLVYLDSKKERYKGRARELCKLDNE
jgi:hypothetical protein